MMLALSTPIRRLLAVSILSVLLLGVWSVAIAPLWQFVRDLRNEIASLEFQRQHLWDVASRQASLEHSVAALHDQIASHAAFWSGPSAAVIAANVQNALRPQAAVDGGQLRSASVLGEVPDGTLHRLSVRLQMEGSLDTLLAVLQYVDASQPSLFIDNLAVSVPSVQLDRRTKPVLTIGFTVTAFFQPARP